MTSRAAIRAQEKLLDASGLVDAAWYLQTYPDVVQSGLTPVQHYVRLGAAMGRNPSPGFETLYYSECIPELVANGTNPLAHYILHGEAEGRIPDPRTALRQVRQIDGQMWGGLGAEADERLTQMLADPTLHPVPRAEVAFRLAVWREFKGDAAGALAILQGMENWAQPAERDGPRRLVMLAVLLIQAGKPDEARLLLERVSPYHTDAALVRAGLAPDDATRLAIINSVYRTVGMLPLAKADPDRPLGMDNLTCAPAACGIPDIGKVSIIVPAYNAEGFIRSTLRALQSQTYRNIEIIVVDDCSPDNTLQVVQQVAATDPRIIPMQARKNAGAYPARNLGLERASGDFLTTHDADDWSHPQKLERQLATLMRNPALVAVAAHWVRCRSDLRVTTNWRLTDNVVHYSHSSFLFRRVVHDRLGQWDPVRAGADTEYIRRCEKTFGKDAVAEIDPTVPLAWALDDDSSLTRSKSTHVSTVYYGVRQIYRQVGLYCMSRKDANSAAVRAARLDMTPPEITQGPQTVREFDLHIVANLADAVLMPELTALVEQAPRGARIGVTHKPEFGRPSNRFCQPVMELAYRRKLDLLVPGADIRAARTEHLQVRHQQARKTGQDLTGKTRERKTDI